MRSTLIRYGSAPPRRTPVAPNPPTALVFGTSHLYNVGSMKQRPHTVPFMTFSNA
jgi:hypothetical protein